MCLDTRRDVILTFLNRPNNEFSFMYYYYVLNYIVKLQLCIIPATYSVFTKHQ